MKVSLDGERLVNVVKKLASDGIDAESIGMILFREKGPFTFRSAPENAIGDASACKKWYLSVIAQMANPCRYGRLLPTGFTGVKSIFLPISKRR
jgi:hypothetical protein